MNRFKYSLLAAAGILVLAFVLTAIGPKRVMAALGYTPVRDVDGPGRQPFSMTAFPGPGGDYYSLNIPSGKRLVITAVSAEALGTTDTLCYISATVNGSASYAVFPYATRGPYSLASVSGEALAHADPSTTVYVFQVGPDIAQVYIHGYLVDVP